MKDGKTCTKCFEWFELTDYNSKGNGKLRSECKTCKRKYDSTRKKVWTRDQLYSVYYLPNENYVGSTNNLRSRISEHKHKKKRDVTNFEVIGLFDTAIKAHFVETFFHLIGYGGFHIGNSKETTLVDTQMDFFIDVKKILQ